MTLLHKILLGIHNFKLGRVAYVILSLLIPLAPLFVIFEHERYEWLGFAIYGVLMCFVQVKRMRDIGASDITSCMLPLFFGFAIFPGVGFIVSQNVTIYIFFVPLSIMTILIYLFFTVILAMVPRGFKGFGPQHDEQNEMFKNIF